MVYPTEIMTIQSMINVPILIHRLSAINKQLNALSVAINLVENIMVNIRAKDVNRFSNVQFDEI